MDKTQQEHYIQDPEVRRLKRDWYNNDNVKDLMLYYMNKRSIGIMSHSNNRYCTRGWRIDNKEWLDKVMEYRDVITHDYSLYMTLSRFMFIPNFTNKLSIRKKETSNWFKTRAMSMLKGFDIFFDFDRHNDESLDDLKEDVKKVSVFLNNCDIDYEVFSSGSGFHLIVYNDNLVLNPFECKEFIVLINDFLDLKTLDILGMSSITKLRKVPYSFVGDTNSIVIPLFTNEIDYFTYGLCDVSNSNVWETVKKFNGIRQVIDEIDRNINHNSNILDLYKRLKRNKEVLKYV